MGGLIPLTDASRRPVRTPLCTAFIILVNVTVFLLELTRGETFVMQWAAIPAQVSSGHQLITIPTAMFMHGVGRTSSATWCSCGRLVPRSKMPWDGPAISLSM